jgi:sugar phosphate isomerase/epimerase
VVKDKAFVFSAIFPGSKTGPAGLKRALDLLSPWNYSTVEYYCQNISPGKAASLLAGKKSVFLAGARQKAEGLNPCSLDSETRRKAVQGLEECFHFAREAGAASVLISSGQRPDSENDDGECLKLLLDSLETLYRAEPGLSILLESGDRDVEYRHLLGHTGMTVEFTASCRREAIPLSLVFDISHIAQLDEDLETAWKTAAPFCEHIHFANCVLDKRLPLYGDKHPFFEVPGGVYTHRDARNFLDLLGAEDKPLTISLEMICPPGENEDDFFTRLTKDTQWFFDY